MVNDLRQADMEPVATLYGTLPIYETAPQPRLIAAAPDLLAALESIASMYDYEAACGDLASRLYEATCLARTAIAKATGE